MENEAVANVLVSNWLLKGIPAQIVAFRIVDRRMILHFFKLQISARKTRKTWFNMKIFSFLYNFPYLVLMIMVSYVKNG